MSGYAIACWPGTDLVMNFRAVDGVEGVMDGETFRSLADGPPPSPVDKPKTEEDFIVAANKQRDELLLIAATRIAPLQDAVDLDDATPEDVSKLKLWKQYRVAVNRVVGQPGYPSMVEWPDQPF
ncbi:tail fiber assembly protein [Pseudomonas sp. MAFF 302030]|uniref:Tail fiber assembly protein n=1 Tax=Pseudomonas morbosilactucae TaxID=2938197 RepID=A0A9X1Z336_9PSED|nr:tail fiber assembly protein [Pseudomonas morbosilactucae]MCK9802079.1 tail fiber assembly protein [Pseudomonas morbosilactucae]